MRFIPSAIAAFAVVAAEAPALAQSDRAQSAWGVFEKLNGKTFFNFYAGPSFKSYEINNNRLRIIYKLNESKSVEEFDLNGNSLVNANDFLENLTVFSNGWIRDRSKYSTYDDTEYCIFNSSEEIECLTFYEKYEQYIIEVQLFFNNEKNARRSSGSYEERRVKQSELKEFKLRTMQRLQPLTPPPSPMNAKPVIAANQPVTPTPAPGSSPTSAQRPAQSPANPPKPAALSGRRIALVIGNATYAAKIGSLANPVNDAHLITASLRAAGFDVVEVDNGDQPAMKQAISAFGRRIAAAGPGATGLFYYAGHGIQSRGVNYLIPTSANLTSEADLDLDGIPADSILSQMEAAGSSTSIVILDACRNMPLVRSFRGGTRGLARMDAPNGSYIAYSTAPGQEAADGTSANSPFATAFATEIKRQGQPIELMFRNIRNTVFKSTGGTQTPWDSSSLFESFVFTP